MYPPTQLVDELRALHTELHNYETRGRSDRADQVRHEIAGRVAVARDTIARLDQAAAQHDQTGAHTEAAATRVRANELRAGLADLDIPESGEADQTTTAAADTTQDPPGEDTAVLAADGQAHAETAADTTPRQRAVPRKK
ncbi:hypothetical protein [Actinocrispum wychmicini]|uniref:hypothetical protein n=1 Tax=Actinocrispum wychmicini TaxID=1213861 RepID=UPI001045DCFB|nr:hypothetical protein [Actinocrispum wychmicini]